MTRTESTAPDAITGLTAQALSAAIHARTFSCREVMQAYLARIHRVNPGLTAIVNLAPDDTLLAQADACDAELAAGRSRGWMHGFPVAIKDTGQAKGFPTSFGSALLARHPATQDSIFVERMKAAGAIVIGKTNMSEFGLGSHSYNKLFGTTLNAWDRRLTAGGSSGGAAVALAQRLLPVADGSDFMGSLRNPAGWNHVFGMRPSQGRVPSWPRPDLWVSQLGTDGPMARTVRDLAALLETQAGYDPRAPLSLATPPGLRFVPGPDVSVRGLRIGWLGDLQGHLAVEDGIVPLCESALQRMAGEGAVVEPVALGLGPACRVGRLAGVALCAGGPQCGRCPADPRGARADQARSPVGIRPRPGRAGDRVHARGAGAQPPVCPHDRPAGHLRRTGAAGGPGLAV
jgi:amidase